MMQCAGRAAAIMILAATSTTPPLVRPVLTCLLCLHASCTPSQAIPFLMFVEVRRKDWLESFAHHIVTLALMYYRCANSGLPACIRARLPVVWPVCARTSK